MALVNQAKREINAKIVFFGPGLAGKSTNLKLIYNKLKPDFRGPLKAMNVQDARMLFFDFTPPGDGNVDGFRVRFHVYTVSGSTVDPAAWKMVLKGVDGIVFVADSQPQRQQDNRESLDNLNSYLKGYGQSTASIPTVFQLNKSDLVGEQGADDFEMDLNPSRLPSFKACSQSGEGVLPCLLGLVKTVLNGLRSKGVQAGTTPETLQGMMETPEPSPQEAPLPEQAAPSAPPAPAAEPEPAPAAEPEPAPVEESASRGDEAGGAPQGVGSAELEETEAEPLSLELSGPPLPAGPGQFRLPLTIRSGARTKSVTLTVAISLEEE